jgi:hypothetical protein
MQSNKQLVSPKRQHQFQKHLRQLIIDLAHDMRHQPTQEQTNHGTANNLLQKSEHRISDAAVTPMFGRTTLITTIPSKAISDTTKMSIALGNFKKQLVNSPKCCGNDD